MTGIFSKKKNTVKNYDNYFFICSNCNHGQLKNQISAKYLYKETYTHRTSMSPQAININQDFYKKLKSIIKNRNFNCIFEVGCNDLLLAKKIRKHAKKIVGIDPIMSDEIKKIDKKISVTGGFINEINSLNKIKKMVGNNKKIDLVISSHTFEHVDKIKESLQKIIDIVDDECLFVIETPSLNSIVKNGHYDQIFHQHLHYVTERSVIELCNQLNCQFVEFKYNYQIWGGNVMYIFKKTKKKIDNKKFISNYKFDLNKIRKDFVKFQKNCVEKVKFVRSQHKNIFAFGAAQMLPVIAYHSKSDFSFFKELYDDNKDRIGRYLPLINKKIKKTNEKKLKDAFVLITANETCRSIIKRLYKINPLRIIVWHSDF